MTDAPFRIQYSPDKRLELSPIEMRLEYLGDWSAGEYENEDIVKHNERFWRANKTTTDEPADLSDDWEERHAPLKKGEFSFEPSTEGFFRIYDGVSIHKFGPNLLYELCPAPAAWVAQNIKYELCPAPAAWVAFLAAPTGLDNEDIASDRFTATWYHNPYADNYTVELSSDGEFENIIDSATVSHSEKTFTGLDASTTYYWRVRSNADDSEYNSDWADRSVTTNTE